MNDASYKQAETDSAMALNAGDTTKLIQAEYEVWWTRAIESVLADYEHQKLHGVRRRLDDETT